MKMLSNEKLEVQNLILDGAHWARRVRFGLRFR